MFYAICENATGYQLLAFDNLQIANQCPAINHKSIVYRGNNPENLLKHYSFERLLSVWQAIGKPMSFVNQQQLVETLHDFVDTKAVVWTPPVEEPMTQPEQVTQPVEKKVETRKRFDPKLSIVPLLAEPPIRQGTNRHRNMAVVMACSTVGEAMTQLRALQPSPGGGTDIQIAIDHGAIELK